jgi:chromosomal replication initiator protein
VEQSQGDRSYTFDTFVRGGSNAFACQAALRLAREDVPSFNPLFIHGGSSLGKSHLLHAISNQLREGGARRVVYASCERFLIDLNQCLEDSRMPEFRERYRQCDALLLDDVQFVERIEKPYLQEELFHTLNDLHARKRPVVLAADVPPAEMPWLVPRLKASFDWGMTAEILPPDRDLRVAIVRFKAGLRELVLSDEVVELVCDLDRSNIRALEGAINTLATYAQFLGRTPDADEVRVLLEPRLKSSVRALSVREIQETVAREFGLELRELLSSRRQRRITLPRQVAMYLAREHARASLGEIAAAFRGKHHATVLHAVNKVRREAGLDPDLRSKVTSLTRKLGRA